MDPPANGCKDAEEENGIMMPGNDEDAAATRRRETTLPPSLRLPSPLDLSYMNVVHDCVLIFHETKSKRLFSESAKEGTADGDQHRAYYCLHKYMCPFHLDVVIQNS